MRYKEFKGLKISELGMGTMRLPTVPGQGEKIDEEQGRELIEAAYAGGINYFDTAYRYHGGESERFVGKVLSQYPRDSFYLATKMPGHMMNYTGGKLGFQGYLAGTKVDSPAQIFDEQLEKCRVDYFDFYLLHNLCETAYDFYTNDELALVEYLLEQKKKGRIRHLGFSAHGRADTIERFLAWSEARYPGGCFEFAQIQVNYLDWTAQDARGKYEVLDARHLPVIAMESCRGGKLANPGEKIDALFKKLRPGDSAASWAFRFVKSLPAMQVTLSGMSSLEQLRDNLKTFSDPAPLSAEEREAIKQAVDSLANFVPCTACRYCCEGCPQKLDIPRLITAFNEMSLGKASTFLSFTLPAMKDGELPSACTGCGSCQRACPQGIEIPAIMGKLPAIIAAQKSMRDRW